MNSWKSLAAGVIVAGWIAVVPLGCKPTSSKEGPTDDLPQTTDDSRRFVGNKAPDFQGDFAVNGKPIKLSDLQGKVVLLDFWAVWCPPCIKSLPHLIELNAKYKASGLEVVGLLVYNYEKDMHYEFDQKTGKLNSIEHFTSQSQQKMFKDFAAYHKIDYLVMTLPDTDTNRVFRAYHVAGIPRLVLIDRRGVVRKAFEGGDNETAIKVEEEVQKLLNEKN